VNKESILNIVFMGTPEYSCPSLEMLFHQDHVQIVGVYTQPPRQKNRGHTIQPSPVHDLANRLGLRVFYPKNFQNPQIVEELKQLDPDLIVVVAYGLLLPKEVLDIPKNGCINAHGSILPRWRGAAPIHRCLMANDRSTGISIMHMDEGLDTGDVISDWPHPIDEGCTYSSLSHDLSILSAHGLQETIKTIVEKGVLNSLCQPKEGVTYAHKIKKEEGLIDFSQSAWDLDARIRALNPQPGTWFFSGSDMIKIRESKPLPAQYIPTSLLVGQWFYDQSHGLLVGCGQDILQVKVLQRPNKKPLAALDFLNGYQLIKK
jgi:methionyl-tRNA formyltransferase